MPTFCHYARHGEMLPVDIPVCGEWQALLPGCLGIYSQANQPENHILMRDVIHCLRGILSLVSLMGDNLGTKIQKKYENRQKVWRKRENTNSHKIIDFSHFTDLYFLFFMLLFSLYHLPMQNFRNIFPNTSSVPISPTISPR